MTVSRKAKHCDDCIFGKYKGQVGEYFECEKGHTPRFYKPAEGDIYGMHSDWGFKRRCNDFIKLDEQAYP